MLKLFPTPSHKNLVICASGVGSQKEWSTIITDKIPDLECVSKSQCFPLYYYTEKKVDPSMLNLFNQDGDGEYEQHDGISDWILKEVKARYHVSPKSKSITKEHIFYYVYGLLHSEDYRERFADDLKKSLPRIPIVESIDKFLAFYNAGKKLANLHLNYESVHPMEGVKVVGKDNLQDEYTYYAIIDKMRYARKRSVDGKLVNDRSVILYNENIRITDIPLKAYQYVVNGRSAIDWILERYTVSVDKKSGIKNDCNDWAREHQKPRYILDLLLSVINVSCQTVDIVSKLPRLQLFITRGSREGIA